jgi:hypothetical protein
MGVYLPEISKKSVLSRGCGVIQLGRKLEYSDWVSKGGGKLNQYIYQGFSSQRFR